LTLFNLKARNGWINKSFTKLLEFLKEILLEKNTLPNRNYWAKKVDRNNVDEEMYGHPLRCWGTFR